MSDRDRGGLIRYPASQRPILVVTVDTEEEFDWHANFSRTARSVTAIQELYRFQEICDHFGIRPIYVVTHPVAAQDVGAAPLRVIHDAERCEIGVHLHPWVTPPYSEEVNRRNSFPGNLPPELEAEKLHVMTELVAATFGSRPRVYKAGRYGLGPRTWDNLVAQGFEVDLSPAPPMDFSADGGPNFASDSDEPYWIDGEGRLMVLPSSGAFIGRLAHPAGAALYAWASRRWRRHFHLPGVLAGLGLLDRLRLSPEGFSLAENKKLTRGLYLRGRRVFQFTFHSPSLLPGATPFVASEAQRNALLDQCESYFRWFFSELNGTAMTPTEVKALKNRAQETRSLSAGSP